MVSIITKKAKKIADTFERFASDYIAPLENLHKSDPFPFDLWEKMGDKGLLGIGVSREYNGKAADCLSMSMAGHALVKNGNNVGIALSWLLHQLCSRFIFEQFGTIEQKNKYLQELATGKVIPCFAISEPKGGAHPKYLETFAEEHPDGYTLNGEKAYLTNGPIADVFVVIAVTGIESGKKSFTAFVVPKTAKGLEMTDPINLPFFKPSPHGGIVLNECKVPKSAILGNKDTAYIDIVLPFRDIEDALMMGPVTGALEKQLIVLSELLNKNNIKPDTFLSMEIGKLVTMLDTAKFIACESAKMIDKKSDYQDKLSLVLFFRNLAREYNVQIEIILKNAKLEKEGILEVLTNEMAASARIGSIVAKTKLLRLSKQLLNR